MTDEGAPKLHAHNMDLTHHFIALQERLNMDEHRVALLLKSGATYFIRDILEEWSNAVYLRPEGYEVKPVLVFKDSIEAVKIMDRPAPRQKSHE